VSAVFTTVQIFTAARSLVDWTDVSVLLLSWSHRQCIYLSGFHRFTQTITESFRYHVQLRLVIFCSTVVVSVFYLFTLINMRVIWVYVCVCFFLLVVET